MNLIHLSALLDGPKDSIFKHIKQNFVLMYDKILPGIDKEMRAMSKMYDKTYIRNKKKYENIQLQRPELTFDGDKYTHLYDALEYLRKIPDIFRLEEFNKMQESTNFRLVDTAGDTTEYVYSTGDFFKFLVNSHDKLNTNLIQTTDNPFYARIIYDIDSLDLDGLLSDIEAKNDVDRYLKSVIFKLDYQKTLLSSLGLGDNVLALTDNLEYMENVYSVLMLYKRINEMKFNPTFMNRKVITSKNKVGIDMNKGPIKRYYEDSFFDIMDQDYFNVLKDEKSKIKKFDYKTLSKYM